MTAMDEMGLTPTGESWAFCSLSAAQRAERIGWIHRSLGPYVRRREEIPAGFAWELADTAASRRRLEEILELERRCCADLEFTLQRVASRRCLRLEVRGPGLDATQLRALRDSALAEGAAGIAWRDAWRAGAVGVGGALLLCCVAPALLSAVAGGAAVAAVGLDRPLSWAVAAAVLASLYAVFTWRRRRSELPAQDDCGC